MIKFFQYEVAYLIIALMALMITWFVATRPFMSKNALKKGVIWVVLVSGLLIGGHYYMTINRIRSVKSAFEQNKQILCESRMLRKAAQSVVVQKSKDWKIVDDTFVSPEFVRPFHISRCIAAKAISLR